MASKKQVVTAILPNGTMVTAPQEEIDLMIQIQETPDEEVEKLKELFAKLRELEKK